ncbi:DEAD/DEAH box helicase [Kangiella sp.]|uniref:DEAD/DEAH box helicase n=1 Tax=Kangiella sp. TaxID=1920245 RepID=UPI003A8F026A
MAFKKKESSNQVPESPDLLFRELSRRRFPDVLPHQKEMMVKYTNEGQTCSDVALQLPTGSGKTLVGLLIAEWRRRKNNERIVYVCPTKQLVNQVVAQAKEKYGLNVVGFTGTKRDYNPGDIVKYRQAQSVAVTTYSSIFNTNPFFDDPDVIIIDDAHAAENYVSTLWSVQINHSDHPHVFQAIANILKEHIGSNNHGRLLGEWDGPSDKAWVDMLPTPVMEEVKQDLMEIISLYSEGSSYKYSWSLLKDHFSSCNLYLSPNNMLIRPIIPPTWTHEAFYEASQRIYMSATLGEGGDLERLVGREKIKRLEVPEGWDTQGVGRRFFIFPTFSLSDEEYESFYCKLVESSDRSLFLVPSDFQSQNKIEILTSKTTSRIYEARDIENSKEQYINDNDAVAIVANRYDGIDFPGDECRLLIIDGLPKTVNLQEQFLMSKMGANTLFNERVQTRVLQSLGRCTRSLEDFSAVVVLGDELSSYLTDIKRRKYFHPELQAEITFGVKQSTDVSMDDLLENYKIFIENDEDWEAANQQILEYRNEAHQDKLPAVDDLSAIVHLEIKYMKALWKGDYLTALQYAEEIFDSLHGPELKGYRALWAYLSGSAAYLATEINGEDLTSKVLAHYSKAKQIAKDIPWLSNLSKFIGSEDLSHEELSNHLALKQVENMESVLVNLGLSTNKKFLNHISKIRDGLEEASLFEESHRLIGELLGFNARKIEVNGSPDPWWQLENGFIVFEDHANAKNEKLSVTKARQAATHPNWMMKNVEGCDGNSEIVTVLVSSVTNADDGAFPHLSNVMFWNLNDFKSWVINALDVIKDLRTSFKQDDLVWRNEAVSRLQGEGLDFQSIMTKLKSNPADKALSA